MAGGTGGHIYPAIAVGMEFRKRGFHVFWMGSHGGMEAKIVKAAGFVFDSIRIRGLWNKGLLRWLIAPVWLTISILQSISVILRRRPDVLLGMGGYVCGPGGVAGWLLRRPLVIHESNAVPGLTNRILAMISTRVLTGFNNVPLHGKPICTGTPVRRSIIRAGQQKVNSTKLDGQKLNLLIIGGSQGANALNEALPEILASMPQNQRPVVRHQTGSGNSEEVANAYSRRDVSAEVFEFIEQMAEAYAWADIVIARSGAMTLAEVSVMGLAAILVPYPHAARNHQQANAEILSAENRAIVCLQDDGLVEKIERELKQLIQDRDALVNLSERIRKAAKIDATDAVVDHCMEVMQ